MARKLTRWLILSFGLLLLAAVMGFAVLYWRLLQGPLALPMLQPRVQQALADSLRPAGMRAQFRDLVLEIDRRRRLPTLRMRDLALFGHDGSELLSAPRAAFSVAMGDLLRGTPRVRHLELVGPALTLRRDANGHMALGNDVPARAPDGQLAPDATAPGQPAAGGLLHDLQQALRAQDAADAADQAGAGEGASPLGALQSISITRADIRYIDNALGLNWRLPETELTLRRVPYGFALMAHGELHGLDSQPLPVELSAAWRRASGRISLSLQTQGLRLGHVLSAVLGVDLRGKLRAQAAARLGAEIDADGALKGIAGEMLLGPGHISFPDWLAQTVTFREGVLRLDYSPASRTLRITRGDLLHDTGHSRLSGTVRLAGQAPGNGLAQARALRLKLDLRHDPATAAAGQALLRRIMLDGQYDVATRVLNIDDLQFFGGGAAMRLRGMIRAEPEGLGLYVSGRARDISHELLKRLWPPKLGAGARQWLRENVSAGRIPQATMRLALPAKVIRAAVERDVPMPDEVADIRFQVRDARFSYVDGWPRVRGASGEGILRGNTFRLTVQSGESRLPSGKVLKLRRGEVRARDLAAKVSPGTIEVRASGPAEGFIELADLPPLRLRHVAGLDKGMITGPGSISLKLALPFHRGLTGSDIRLLKAGAKVRKARVIGMMPGQDLSDATLDFSYEKDVLKASGRARLAGLPIRLAFTRPIDERARAKKTALRIETRLDEAAQRRLGIDMAPWLRGPVDVAADLQLTSDGRLRQARVRAGLDAVAMQLQAIGWRRAPRKGTRATFDLIMPRKKGAGLRVENLRLRGPGGLRVEGRLRLNGEGRFEEATFSRFELNANNRLALGLNLRGNRLEVAAAGPVFDARTLMARLFAPSREIDRTLREVFVRVNLKRVLALRGEYIENVRGEVELRDGLVRRASLTGNFPNGRKVVLDLTPAANGLRRLRIVSDDAGALLRASDLYSRVVGGTAEFTALLKSGDDGGVQRGLLIMRRFEVRGDQRLARLQQRGNDGKRRAGPRRGQRFRKLVLPFSTDSRFIRIGDAIIRSPEIGATANGMIRRADGAMDIGGVIIPAYALNAAFGKIPVLGALLTGGRGQGVFGMTYALKGSMSRPKFLVNPLSAVAPGVFRQLFHIGGQNVNPDGTPRRRGGEEPRKLLRRNNLANGG